MKTALAPAPAAKCARCDGYGWFWFWLCSRRTGYVPERRRHACATCRRTGYVVARGTPAARPQR